MKRSVMAALLGAGVLMAVGTTGMAADHGSGHGSAGHGTAAGHSATAADLVSLGEATEAGVKAAAGLRDVRAAMAQAGQSFTHHLQLTFTDRASGNPVTEGTVAVKVTAPDGQEGPAMALTGMDGHFGVDLELKRPGKYSFAVGTKLADGTRRQYLFQATVK
ncbi:MAG: hypothetical protein AB1634_11830 [Thermodesulfobacteriota bacterium]